MNNLPLVSIITPVLNQASYIGSTIDSVLSQDYSNLEYRIIDGGSTDGTVEILQSYKERFHWISESDRGQSDAINKGFRQARGEILAWLNGDDIFYPQAVSNAVSALQINPSIGAVYGDCDYIDSNGEFVSRYPVRPYDYDDLVLNNEDYIPQPTVFFRRQVIENIGYLNPSLHYALDYDYWLRLGLKYPMEYIPKRMAALRLHSDAKSIGAVAKFGPELIQVHEQLMASPELPAHLHANRNQAMSNAYLHAASCVFWSGHTKQARRYLFDGARCYPKVIMRRSFLLLLSTSILGKLGWKLAVRLHGNPYRLGLSLQ